MPALQSGRTEDRAAEWADRPSAGAGSIIVGKGAPLPSFPDTAKAQVKPALGKVDADRAVWPKAHTATSDIP